MEYLENMEISLTDNSSTDLLSIQRVYYNYGFSFMCTSVGGGSLNTYPEIMEYYMQTVHQFIKKLDDNQKNSQEEYLAVLNQYSKNDKLLEEELPYLFNTKSWLLNEERFNNEEAKEFLKTLQERIEKVRPYRNAITHNLDNEYSLSDTKNAICSEIRLWLDEYAELFRGC